VPLKIVCDSITCLSASTTSRKAITSRHVRESDRSTMVSLSAAWRQRSCTSRFQVSARGCTGVPNELVSRTMIVWHAERLADSVRSRSMRNRDRPYSVVGTAGVMSSTSPARAEPYA